MTAGIPKYIPQSAFRDPHSRRGLSLLEILISLFILLLGVTSLLALFPVGVDRVRQAVLDTRCTLLAQSMWSSVELLGLTDDPLHLAPNLPPDVWQANNYLLPNTQSGYDPKPNKVVDAVRKTLDLALERDPVGPQLNYYNTVDNSSGPGTSLSPLASTGVPLLIDPLWVHAATAVPGPINNAGPNPNRHTQIAFSDARYLPIRAVTTWGAACIEDPAVRGAYIRRWFTSPGDIKFQEEMPGVYAPGLPISIKNASVRDPLDRDYSGGSYPLPFGSANRSYDYSWALLIQRDVSPNLAAGNMLLPPIVGGIPPRKQALLIFYKRNLEAYPNPNQSMGGPPMVPYFVAQMTSVKRMDRDKDREKMGVVNGDNRIYIHYDRSLGKPRIRKGTWLADITVTGTGPFDPTNPAVNRRSFDFYRVAGLLDKDVNTKDPQTKAIEVILEWPLRGYVEQGRGNKVNPSVVVFDGLQEVFSRDGLWK